MVSQGNNGAMGEERVLVLAVVTDVHDDHIAYPSCTACYSKLLLDPTTSRYHCLPCGASLDGRYIEWRFRLVVSISDGATLARVVVFGQTLHAFIGKTATDFQRSLDRLEKTGYPSRSLLTEALHRTFIAKYFYFGFKLTGRSYSGADDDDDLVSPYSTLGDVVSMATRHQCSGMERGGSRDSDNTHILAYQMLEGNSGVFATVTDHMRLLVKQLRTGGPAVTPYKVCQLAVPITHDDIRSTSAPSLHTPDCPPSTVSSHRYNKSYHTMSGQQSLLFSFEDDVEDERTFINTASSKLIISRSSMMDIGDLAQGPLAEQDAEVLDAVTFEECTTNSQSGSFTEYLPFTEHEKPMCNRGAFEQKEHVKVEKSLCSKGHVRQKLYFDSQDEKNTNTSKMIDQELKKREVKLSQRLFSQTKHELSSLNELPLKSKSKINTKHAHTTKPSRCSARCLGKDIPNGQLDSQDNELLDQLNRQEIGIDSVFEDLCDQTKLALSFSDQLYTRHYDKLGGSSFEDVLSDKYKKQNDVAVNLLDEVNMPESEGLQTFFESQLQGIDFSLDDFDDDMTDTNEAPVDGHDVKHPENLPKQPGEGDSVDSYNAQPDIVGDEVTFSENLENEKFDENLENKEFDEKLENEKFHENLENKVFNENFENEKFGENLENKEIDEFLDSFDEMSLFICEDVHQNQVGDRMVQEPNESQRQHVERVSVSEHRGEFDSGTENLESFFNNISNRYEYHDDLHKTSTTDNRDNRTSLVQENVKTEAVIHQLDCHTMVIPGDQIPDRFIEVSKDLTTVSEVPELTRPLFKAIVNATRRDLMKGTTTVLVHDSLTESVTKQSSVCDVSQDLFESQNQNTNTSNSGVSPLYKWENRSSNSTQNQDANTSNSRADSQYNLCDNLCNFGAYSRYHCETLCSNTPSFEKEKYCSSNTSPEDNMNNQAEFNCHMEKLGFCSYSTPVLASSGRGLDDCVIDDSQEWSPFAAGLSDCEMEDQQKAQCRSPSVGVLSAASEIGDVKERRVKFDARLRRVSTCREMDLRMKLNDPAARVAKKLRRRRSCMKQESKAIQSQTSANVNQTRKGNLKPEEWPLADKMNTYDTVAKDVASTDKYYNVTVAMDRASNYIECNGASVDLSLDASPEYDSSQDLFETSDVDKVKDRHCDRHSNVLGVHNCPDKHPLNLSSRNLSDSIYMQGDDNKYKYEPHPTRSSSHDKVIELEKENKSHESENKGQKREESENRRDERENKRKEREIERKERENKMQERENKRQESENKRQERENKRQESENKRQENKTIGPVDPPFNPTGDDVSLVNMTIGSARLGCVSYSMSSSECTSPELFNEVIADSPISTPAVKKNIGKISKLKAHHRHIVKGCTAAKCERGILRTLDFNTPITANKVMSKNKSTTSTPNSLKANVHHKNCTTNSSKTNVEISASHKRNCDNHNDIVANFIKAKATKCEQAEWDVAHLNNVSAGQNSPSISNVSAGQNSPNISNVSAGQNSPSISNVSAGQNSPSISNVSAGQNSPVVSNVDTAETVESSGADDSMDIFADSPEIVKLRPLCDKGVKPVPFKTNALYKKRFPQVNL